MGKKKATKNETQTPTQRKRPVVCYPMQLPHRMSRDELDAMSDDELVARINAMNADICFVAERCPLPTKPWEQEIAYAQRELGWRFDRRRLHEAYKQSQQQAS